MTEGKSIRSSSRRNLNLQNESCATGLNEIPSMQSARNGKKKMVKQKTTDDDAKWASTLLWVFLFTRYDSRRHSPLSDAQLIIFAETFDTFRPNGNSRKRLTRLPIDFIYLIFLFLTSHQVVQGRSSQQVLFIEIIFPCRFNTWHDYFSC